MRPVAAAVATATCAACLWNSPPHKSLARALESSEIVGTWSITQDSLGDYKAEGLSKYATQEAHRLEFREDGTCSVDTLLGGTMLGQPAQASMPCRWRVVPQRDGPSVSLTIEVRPGTLVGEGYSVGEEEGRLILWNYITDPDSRRYAEFRKSS
jgi:hypothetical protein